MSDTLTVKGFAGLGQVVQQNRKQVTRKLTADTQKREYRTFTNKSAILAAMADSIDKAGVTDGALMTAYQVVVASGLIQQGQGYGPWSPFWTLAEAGVTAETLTKLEAAGLTKSTISVSKNGRRYRIHCARLFFTDASPVKRVKSDSGIAQVMAMLADDDESTGTKG